MRIYELAKELGVSSKELITKLEEFDCEVSSHMSSIDKEIVELLKEAFNGDAKYTEETEEDENMREIYMGESITVKDLAEKIEGNVNKIITKLISLGVMASINQEINFDTASIVAEDFGIIVKKESNENENENDELNEVDETLDFEDSEESLVERSAIVTVMGHVDHGKTSLLDAIRKTDVTAVEAGGITQHIGASTVEINDKEIVFLDTPGHEAFTAMRARGAQVTDIAILVVAADDGIMPQTIEAINHAKAANVPIIVAINKIDKVDANPERIMQELTEYGLVPEPWGGDTICMPVSALKREGIDELLEMILLVSEMQELKANPNRKAKGTIIEAQLDKSKGPIATVLVEKGTLKIGDAVVVGTTHGKVRAILDNKGKKLKTARPSTAVVILGLSEVPNAGEHLYAVNNDKEARRIAEDRIDKQRLTQLKTTQMISLDDLFDQIKKGKVKDLNLIVKADVKGSIEAIKQSLQKLSIEEVNVNPIHGGVGAITENDIMLASASNAIVIGFNVRPTSSAMNLAEREEVDVRTYRVIYHAIEDIKDAIKGMLDPEYKEVVLGRAEVRATFKVPNIGVIAGIYVLEGKMKRNASVRLLRDNVVIHEGDIASLKRFKDDAKELNTGYEGGLGIDKFNDIKEGDVIEAYIMEEIKK